MYDSATDRGARKCACDRCFPAKRRVRSTTERNAVAFEIALIDDDLALDAYEADLYAAQVTASWWEREQDARDAADRRHRAIRAERERYVADAIANVLADDMWTHLSEPVAS